ncbi:Oidioi.mRNA.OKI2018_I69.chr2.g6324.t1.cds [Oikopleura dioica]|uniref:Oidioi.mRNA.OKI2018_I69.chr2.g6324.t1.cds n=1 Tax=Oikopleura dioica TaxID=34765 RepID=A0ABN7T2P4_OIKDI|nr:Oidioi.mRNA.OKI2018_I69.chr2.g6324.t1.cds [Oikopleura dioica]
MRKGSYIASENTKELMRQAFEKQPYPTRQEREELASELDVPIHYLSKWFNMRRYHYKKAKKALPGEKTVSTRKRGQTKHNQVKEATITKERAPQTQESFSVPSVDEGSRPMFSQNAAGQDKIAEKRSRYMRLLKEHNEARREHSADIMDLQERITELQQKLEEKMRLYKSETEIIDNIKANAAVENIQLSEEEEDDASDEEDFVVTLLNLKSEAFDEEN